MTTLFENALILNSDGNYIENGFVAIDGNRIASVSSECPNESFDRSIDCRGKLLMPAFYNIHCHSPMVLFRGIGEDLPLQRWLEEKIYPAEDKLTPEKVRYGTMLSIAEMLKSGCVSFSDMYFFSNETANVALECGVKANISRCLLSFSEESTVVGDERFEEATRLWQDFNGAGDGRIIVDASVHAEYTNKARYCREVAEIAHERGQNIQVHLSETKLEHDECKMRNSGMTPTEFLVKNGILVPTQNSTTTAAHCVWVSDEDIDWLYENRVSVAHNPISNLKLASGVAPIKKMLDRGVNVGLGTDGAASNNNQSVLRELQTAALIHKGVNLRADIIPTSEFIKMATENGAKAQGRHDCGKIAEGCRADLILFDLDSINNIPMYDPNATIAFSANSNDVTLTMCDGKILYENGEFTTIDIEKMKAEFKRVAKI